MGLDKILKIKYKEEEIENKRNEIRNKIIEKSCNIKTGSIKVISERDLYITLELYDEIFFNNCLKENFRDNLKLSLSKRMSSNAGKTVVKGDNYEIVISVKLLFNYDDVKRNKKVSGIVTKDSLHSMQLIFEHELIHLIEFYIFKKSSCKKQRFKTLSKNIFAHKDVYHQLPLDREIVTNGYGYNIGDKVTFIFKGDRYNGIISSINKRATVMVLDSKGEYVDKYKNRYTKWYVPLKNLKQG